MPLFILSLLTLIVSLIWSVQLFAPLPLTGVVIFLNLWFMFSWMLLAYAYVRKTLNSTHSLRIPLLS